MDFGMIIIVVTVLLALGFDFINGFHDTANAIATAVSTRALSLRKAIIMAAVMNFIGAIMFTGVAQAIATKVLDTTKISNSSMQAVVIAALVSAIVWNLFTWYFGIPSSSSHALLGSLLGAGIADAGASAAKLGGVLKMIEGLLFSPLLAFGVGYLVFSLIKIVFKRANLAKANNGFRKIQIFTAALQAFSHGTNDAQKSMGIITMALVAHGLWNVEDGIPWYVKFSCALAMALGTSVGGWRIIKTVGTQIMKLKPVNGVAADLSSAAIILCATAVSLPVSTTHVISSSIMGVGTAHRVKGVKWKTAQRMVITWFTTIPITAILAAGIFAMVHLFIK